MAKKHHKFESEVHLGLLVIVFVLLLLNFVSNVVVFKTRMGMQESASVGLRTAALAVVRVAQQSIPAGLSELQKREFRQRYQLADLLVIPAPPPVSSSEYRTWFRSLVDSLPQSRIKEFSEKLLKAEPNRLTRGLNDDYFYVSPVTAGSVQRLVILSREYPDLAYLEDAGRVVLLVGEIGIALVALVYLLVSRFIFTPFRKIRQRALEAGRNLDGAKDEVEGVVAEYQRVIADLQDKEGELTRLNATIQERADSIEEFNRYLLSSVDSGVVTLDPGGKILSLSSVAARILGIEPADAIGEHYGTFLERSPQLAASVRSALESQQTPAYQEYEFPLTPEKTAVIGVAVSAIRGSSGHRIGLSVLVNDLTELVSLRQQLEQKNRLEALGEMAGGLAHQLRNSMGAIVGYGTLVKKKLSRGETEQGIGAADSLLREAREAEMLITKFLAFARPFDFRPEPVNLCMLLEDILSGFRLREDCRNVRFLRAGQDETSFAADDVLFKQAVTNLIENAVKAYDGKPGEVRVITRRDEGTLVIEIQDDGCGIPAGQITKVFTPFYSSRPSGTGLGLPLASRIVTLHGGTITVESQIGVGTTFRITLDIGSGAVESRVSGAVAH